MKLIRISLLFMTFTLFSGLWIGIAMAENQIPDSTKFIVFDSNFDAHSPDNSSGIKITPNQKILLSGSLPDDKIYKSIHLSIMYNGGIQEVDAVIKDDKWSAVIGEFLPNKSVIIKIDTKVEITRQGLQNSIEEAFTKVIVHLTKKDLTEKDDVLIKNIKKYLKRNNSSDTDFLTLKTFDGESLEKIIVKNMVSQIKEVSSASFAAYVIDRDSKIVAASNAAGKKLSHDEIAKIANEIDAYPIISKTVTDSILDEVKDSTIIQEEKIIAINSTVSDIDYLIKIHVAEMLSAQPFDTVSPYILITTGQQPQEINLDIPLPFVSGSSLLKLDTPIKYYLTAGVAVNDPPAGYSKPYFLGASWRINELFSYDLGFVYTSLQNQPGTLLFAGGVSIDARWFGDFLSEFTGYIGGIKK